MSSSLVLHNSFLEVPELGSKKDLHDWVAAVEEWAERNGFYPWV